MRPFRFLIPCLILALPAFAAKATPAFALGYEPGETVNWRLGPFVKACSNHELVLAGKASMLFDNMTNTGEWNEFLHTQPDKVKLAGKATYTVSFKYRILDKKDDKGTLYFLARAGSGKVNVNDKGWTEIKDAKGSAGTKVITFTLDDFPDYRLTIGFRYQGKVLIDDFRVYSGEVKAADL